MGLLLRCVVVWHTIGRGVANGPGIVRSCFSPSDERSWRTRPLVGHDFDENVVKVSGRSPG